MSTSATRTPTRSDGEQSRERLVMAALRLFAQHGFAKASTREIAEAAGTNVAAISYYFGDKAGLYRAAFVELQADAATEIARFADPALTLAQALRGLFVNFVEPLRHGELAEQCMKLYMREILEPTGVCEREIQEGIVPKQRALEAVLCRHLGLRRSDDEVSRLAFSLVGLGLNLHMCPDVMKTVSPGLRDGDPSLDLWIERLTMYGCALVEAERRRREKKERAATASAPSKRAAAAKRKTQGALS